MRLLRDAAEWSGVGRSCGDNVEHYYRGGSTNQMLEGAALDRFLLRKHGRTWDSAPLPGPTVADLDGGAPTAAQPPRGGACPWSDQVVRLAVCL